MFKTESAIVIYDSEIITASKGDPCSVEFDFEIVWEFLKEKRNKRELDEDLLHFIHLHPPGCYGYSGTDVICMKALNIAFGFPVNFWIFYPDKDKPSLVSCVRYQYIDGKVISDHFETDRKVFPCVQGFEGFTKIYNSLFELSH